MNPILLDTHALVWLLEGEDRLGPESRRLADAAATADSLLVSAMTFWEVAMLARRHRLVLAQPVATWRQRALEMGVDEIALSGDISILATELKDFPPNPADRIIAATALVYGATLITADTSVLRWTGQLRCHDARG